MYLSIYMYIYMYTHRHACTRVAALTLTVRTLVRTESGLDAAKVKYCGKYFCSLPRWYAAEHTRLQAGHQLPTRSVAAAGGVQVVVWRRGDGLRM